MKTIRIILITFLLTSLPSGLTRAQIGARKAHDPRIEKLLDAIDLSYEIDSDGDFKLINRFDSGRTHVIFINSNTESYLTLEIREIWSVGLISDTSLSSSEMRRLLRDNANKKLGSWKIVNMGGKEVAVFYAQVAAEADRDAFISALQIVSQSADEMEKTLTGKDDL